MALRRTCATAVTSGWGFDMARFILNTKDLGALEFSAPDDGGYVLMLLAGANPARQICEGGGYMGSTLTANARTLQDVVRKWNRQRRAAMRKEA